MHVGKLELFIAILCYAFPLFIVYTQLNDRFQRITRKLCENAGHKWLVLDIDFIVHSDWPSMKTVGTDTRIRFRCRTCGLEEEIDEGCSMTESQKGSAGDLSGKRRDAGKV